MRQAASGDLIGQITCTHDLNIRNSEHHPIPGTTENTQMDNLIRLYDVVCPRIVSQISDQILQSPKLCCPRFRYRPLLCHASTGRHLRRLRLRGRCHSEEMMRGDQLKSFWGLLPLILLL